MTRLGILRDLFTVFLEERQPLSLAHKPRSVQSSIFGNIVRERSSVIQRFQVRSRRYPHFPFRSVMGCRESSLRSPMPLAFPVLSFVNNPGPIYWVWVSESAWRHHFAPFCSEAKSESTAAHTVRFLYRRPYLNLLQSLMVTFRDSHRPKRHCAKLSSSPPPT